MRTVHAAQPHPDGTALTPYIDQLGTILSIWAHPDDETFLAGGVMAAAVQQGNKVVCVSATSGEHGTGDAVEWPTPVERGDLALHLELWCDELDQKLAALYAMHSQIAPALQLMSPAVLRSLYAQESFVAADPFRETSR